MRFISRHTIGILIVLAITGWALFYVPNTPSYAIYQLKQAIDARDGATAATFVDFNSVVKNAGYEMMQRNANGGDVLSTLVGKGAVDLLAAPMAAALQHWATQQVNDGAKQVQMPAAAVIGALVVLHRSGDAAWTDFRDNKGQQWDIRMGRESGRWRIIEVKNVEQLLQRLQRGEENPPPAPGTAPPAPAAPGGGMPATP